ncbi:DUF4190 domain-containing protein [Mycobacterium crocinum]|uniref:DUF4190 domain-containing protein n=1 Tax=Mycolicibacterium crocinum TaxID=388459 RepID=A0ABY3TF14_9MYCO|nr:DUF4190 domain-containing protein [Mycolicibacterium crocinum]MCV7217917.1 DUF4190 domain-containing protein [Mycolicibacterium crocinum]ULN39700.1 DUF4190 domain-containing protein [Mycolicibacterium crocinum]
MTEPPEQAPQQPTPPPQQAAPPPPPPGYPAPPYGQYPGGYPPAPPQPYAGYTPPPTGPRNGLGVTALVIAIVALLSSFSVVGGIILGIVAVIIGFAGRSRVKRGEANNGGVALAGIILGFLAIIVGLAFIAVWVGVFKEVGATDYIDCLQKAGQDQQQVQQCADEFKQSVENKFSVTLTPTP